MPHPCRTIENCGLRGPLLWAIHSFLTQRETTPANKNCVKWSPPGQAELGCNKNGRRTVDKFIIETQRTTSLQFKARLSTDWSVRHTVIRWCSTPRGGNAWWPQPQDYSGINQTASLCMKPLDAHWSSSNCIRSFERYASARNFISSLLTR